MLLWETALCINSIFSNNIQKYSLNLCIIIYRFSIISLKFLNAGIARTFGLFRRFYSNVMDFSQNGLQTLNGIKSSSKGSVLKGSLEVLHTHIPLVALLGVGHIMQPSADQHESVVAIRETTHDTSAATNLPVEPFNDVIGMDASLVLIGKIAAG